jgi:hypothetical protein
MRESSWWEVSFVLGLGEWKRGGKGEGEMRAYACAQGEVAA